MRFILQTSLIILLMVISSVVNSYGQGTFAIIKDANSGSAGSDPIHLFKAGDKIYFLTQETSGAGNLWVTRGQPDDAELLLEFTVPLVLGAAITFEVAHDGIVYFTLDETTFTPVLYLTDGTAAGTTPLIRPEQEDFNGLQYFFELAGELYFVNYEENLELWATDGTPAGASLIKSFCAYSNLGECYAQAHNNNTVTILNDEAYLFIKTPEYGQELWVTDGTASGTNVIDLFSGPEHHIFDYQRSIAFDDKVYFQSSNGNNPANTISNSGDELYVTDGSLLGTSQFLDINLTSGNGYFNLHSRAHNLYTDGNKFYFYAIDGVNGEELHISDGTVSGTAGIGDVLPGNTERGVQPRYYKYNDQVLFNYSDGYYDEPNDVRVTQLWSSDGTVGGTSVLKEFNSVYSPFVPLLEYDGELYFKSRTFSDGRELWKTDGSTGGTVRLKNINPGSGHAMESTTPVIELNGMLYFIADNGSGYSIWQSDGTEAGTNPVEISGGVNIGSVEPDEIVLLNGKLLFKANINNSGEEVWSYTPGIGTASVETLNLAEVTYDPVNEQLILQHDPGIQDDFHFVLTDIAGRILFKEDLRLDRNQYQIRLPELGSTQIVFWNISAGTAVQSGSLLLR